jgi:hypothetical protein
MADKKTTISEPQPNYDRFAADPERWGRVGRMGFDPDAPPPASIKGESYPKKGSYTVPQMCGGGKVIKTWSK